MDPMGKCVIQVSIGKTLLPAIIPAPCPVVAMVFVTRRQERQPLIVQQIAAPVVMVFVIGMELILDLVKPLKAVHKIVFALEVVPGWHNSNVELVVLVSIGGLIRGVVALNHCLLTHLLEWDQWQTVGFAVTTALLGKRVTEELAAFWAVNPLGAHLCVKTIAP